MRSSPEPSKPAESTEAGAFTATSRWNRKLHYYFGLYFLFFVWLFALTGLLLNHGAWKFAEFWPGRNVSTMERTLEAPPAGSTLDVAREVMRQAGIAGEIQWLTTPADAARLDFRVARPGLQFEIKADFQNRRATIQRTEVNAWGVMHFLHTFTGVRANDAKNTRDWIVTKAWAFSMDAVAVGLLAMVVSGLFMWFGLPAKRAWGIVALASGIVSCGWFVLGWRLLG
ncbi:MAG: hypothetical protein EXS37_03390 [Opitutus sp.]|nr:hypothetical protein [Opitutus sp.]